MKYTKQDVETRRISFYDYPTVNIKAHSFYQKYDDCLNLLCKVFGEYIREEDLYTEEIHDQYYNQIFEDAQYCFWNFDIQEIVENCFWEGCSYYSTGRQGGWLIIKDLKDINEWDAIDLSKWRSFEIKVKRLVNYYCSQEFYFENLQRLFEDKIEEFKELALTNSHAEYVIKEQEGQKAFSF